MVLEPRERTKWTAGVKANPHAGDVAIFIEPQLHAALGRVPLTTGCYLLFKRPSATGMQPQSGYRHLIARTNRRGVCV